MTAEQSKVAALQHSLEEQRRVMTQQLAMEREELERAKVKNKCPCCLSIRMLSKHYKNEKPLY